MNKLSKIKRSESNTYFTNKEHTIKFPLNLLYLNYESKVDLKGKVYYDKNENAPTNVPTINQLIKNKELEAHQYVKEHTICVKDCNDCYDSPNKIDFKTIQKEFKDNGLNVSIAAIQNVWYAWKHGCKVGYRSKETHLFAPCGELNPFSITATKLDPHFKEWQKTYCC